MFHEVLVISYIKICKFSAVISRDILVFFWNVLSSLQRKNTNHLCKETTFTKASSPKKYTVIHKTLITAAFSRRFKFFSVRRRFVICDFKLLRERQIYRSFALREIFIKPLVYVLASR